jgi:hypothetical protein
MRTNHPVFEFHFSRAARERYKFDDSLFELHGRVIIADFHAAREVAQKINAARDLIRHPEEAVNAGQINAIGLLEEMMHQAISIYRKNLQSDIFEEIIQYLETMIGWHEIDELMHSFCELFPPRDIYKERISVDKYLSGFSDSISNRTIVLEEMIMVWIANQNPAMSKLKFLFDASPLDHTVYLSSMRLIEQFFQRQPGIGTEHFNLIEYLRQPFLRYPNTLAEQLGFLRSNWSFVKTRASIRILSGLDLIREEEKPVFPPGPGPVHVLSFSPVDVLEPE